MLLSLSQRPRGAPQYNLERVPVKLGGESYAIPCLYAGNSGHPRMLFLTGHFLSTGWHRPVVHLLGKHSDIVLSDMSRIPITREGTYLERERRWPMTLNEATEIAAALVRAHEHKGPLYCFGGHSLGGRVALEVGGTYADNVVVVNGGLPTGQTPNDHAVQGFGGVMHALFFSRGPPIMRAMRTAQLLSRIGKHAGQSRALSAELARDPYISSPLGRPHAMHHKLEHTLEQLERRLELKEFHLKKPTLVLSTYDDELFPWTDFMEAYVRTHCKNPTIDELPTTPEFNGRHCWHMDYPRLLAEKIERFHAGLREEKDDEVLPETTSR